MLPALPVHIHGGIEGGVGGEGVCWGQAPPIFMDEEVGM